MCFGITAGAQNAQNVIKKIGQNITDAAHDLVKDTYVILKNVSTSKYVYVDTQNNNALKMGVQPNVDDVAGTSYLWQVGVTKDNMYFFKHVDGSFFPRPKTLEELSSKGGYNETATNGSYKGLFGYCK